MGKGLYVKWMEPDGQLMLRAWARDGLSDDQIAKNIGISKGTLYNWKSKYKEIEDALSRGREVVDAEVENSLYKRCLGYDYTETVKELDADGNVKREKIMRKHMPADINALKMWLTNRKPSVWKDKPEEEEKAREIAVKLINMESAGPEEWNG